MGDGAPHPARYPAELPEHFIRMLTDSGDLVVDPHDGQGRIPHCIP